MKTVLLSLLLLAATAPLSVGQGRFSLSATAAPTWHNFDYAIEMEPSGSSGSVYDYFGTDQGGTLGLTASYPFHPSWSASTGLWYNRSRGTLTSQLRQNGNTGDGQTVFRRVQNTLQLPVLINFSPTRHRLSPYLSAGFLVGRKYKSLTRFPNDKDEDEPRVTRSQKLDTYAMVGAGVQYRVSSRWSLIVQSTALYRLRGSASERKDGPFARIRTYKDRELGAQAQVKYTF